MKKAYISALVATILGGQSPAEALAGVRAVMAKRGHLKLMSQVLHGAERELAVKLVRQTPTITLAKAEADSTSDWPAALMSLHTDPATEPRVVVDESLIGGFIARHKDQQIDQSYKRSLLKLYRQLTN